MNPASEPRSIQSGPILIPASSVETKKITWLWPGKIPRAKITIIDGDPDKGKTLAMVDIAARVTRGREMPDGSRGLDGPQNVIFSSTEDDLEDTLRPRLEAAGADLDRVFFLNEYQYGGKKIPLLFPSAVPFYIDAINEKNAALAVLDPLFGFVGQGTDSHKDDSTRRAILSPLKDAASQTGAAIVGIRHLKKGREGKAIHRGGGTVAIISAARSGLVVAEHPEDPERRVLAVTKSNLTRDRRSFSFRIVSCDKNPDVPRVEWSPKEERINATELLSDEPGTGALREAEAFLEQLIGDPGFLPSAEVYKEASRQGVAKRTLKRAKKNLKIGSWKENDTWFWGTKPSKSASKGANVLPFLGAEKSEEGA